MLRKRPDRIRGIAGSLDDKRVLIADSATGAGPGIARVVAEAGATVVIATLETVTLDLQLRELAAAAGSVSGRAGSLDRPSDFAGLLSALDGPLDMAVVNPSVFDLDPDLAATGSHLHPQGGVNLAQLAAASMRDRGTEGSIVFVTGIGQAGPADAAIAFLTAEMERLAIECAPNAIRVNAVAPGFIKTDMTEGIEEKQYRSIIPLRRFGTVDEVADVVAFLASAKASYITGEVISINGGLHT